MSLITPVTFHFLRRHRVGPLPQTTRTLAVVWPLRSRESFAQARQGKMTGVWVTTLDAMCDRETGDRACDAVTSCQFEMRNLLENNQSRAYPVTSSDWLLLCA